MNLYALLALALLAGLSGGFALGSTLERQWGDKRHIRDLERITNLLTIGTPEPKARRLEAPPSAEKRAITLVESERVSRAAAVLQERYKEKGLDLSSEEAQVQARSMLAGNSPFGERVGAG